jgi:signal transduction histidine kinase/ligand-binding sensor domain-containing protein
VGILHRLICVGTLGLAALMTPAVQALPSSLSISQYKHTRWTVDDGAPPSINTLVQGRDGFLWLGAENGLFRFDGLTFQAIAPEHQVGDRSSVTALLSAADGSVWVGYGAGGIARYASGVLRDANAPRSIENVQQLLQTRDGAIWGLLSGSDRPLVRFLNGKWLEVGGGWGLPVEQGVRLLVARDGTLWFATSKRLFFLRPGSRRFEPSSFIPTGSAALVQDKAGVVWAADRVGARPVNGISATRYLYRVPYAPRRRRAIFDRDGNLWGNSDEGIYRISAPDAQGEPSASAAVDKIDRFRASASLTSDQVEVVLEDREGTIWVATELGLDRFRAATVVTEQSLTKVPQWGSVLLASSNGDVFFGQSGGVYRARPGQKPEEILTGDGDAEAMCQGLDGSVWIVLQQRIVRLKDGHSTMMRKPATRQAIIDCAVGHRGTLFLTAGEGLFEHVVVGWRLYPIEQDAQTAGAMPLIVRRDGKLLTYPTGRSLRVYDLPGHTDIVLGPTGIIRQLNTLYERPHSILLGGRFGLAKWHGRTFRYLSRNRIPAFAGTTGIVSTPQGETWVMSRAGIVRIATADLDRAFETPGWNPPLAIYDSRDGLLANAHGYGKRDAVRGGDGRLWFATSGGIVWVDPAHMPRNPLPPPVAITMLRVNGATYRDPKAVVVEPGAGRIAIDFSALSLSIPERVRMRYRLEGVDDVWNEAGSIRRATYTNLGPGNYRFRVIAANDAGVWNRAGATLRLTIQPTFRQSSAFFILCAGAALMSLWGASTFRTRQLSARIRERLEAQINERERIARELHDTLLQGFQGLLLRFQSVANRMLPDSPLRSSMDQALDNAEAVLTEGRNRVSDLRFAVDDQNLAGAIVAIATKIGVDPELPITVTVEGGVRALEPMIGEELLRIAEEAIRNALQHSSASRIEVALMYGRQLQLGVRDNGCGLPDDVVASGNRAGHFGLTGMRERTHRIGGDISLASAPLHGTEVIVTIPGRLAYRNDRT